MGSHPADKFLSKKQVISHPFGKQKAERAQWICERRWTKHSSLKHMPPTDHFLSNGVALLGKNEIICLITEIQFRGEQSLAIPTTVRFMFLSPKTAAAF